MAERARRSKIVGTYVDFLATDGKTITSVYVPNGSRGGKKSDDPDVILAAAAKLKEKVPTTRGHKKVDLVQKIRDLEAAAEALRLNGNGDGPEANFIKVAAAYSAEKGTSYDTWRELGVKPRVLKLAGITR